MQHSITKSVAALAIVLAAGGFFRAANCADLPDKYVHWSPIAASRQLDAAAAVSSTKSDEASISSRNSGKAFFKSLLVPGWGQYVQGRKRLATVYFVGEILLIASMIMERTYAGWLEDEYVKFAAQHAGVSGDKSHGHYVDIGNWMDTRSFNERRLRDRQYDRLYTNPRMTWSWDSDQNRREFKATRLASDHARQRGLLLVGGIFLNHMISGIEASRVQKSPARVSLKTTVNDDMVGLKVGITWR